MFGAFVGYFVLLHLGIERLPLPFPVPILLSYVVAFTAAAISAGVLAVATERIAYRPVRKAGRIAALITAVCVSLILQNLAIKAWDAAPRAYPEPRETPRSGNRCRSRASTRSTASSRSRRT